MLFPSVFSAAVPGIVADLHMTGNYPLGIVKGPHAHDRKTFVYCYVGGINTNNASLRIHSRLRNIVEQQPVPIVVDSRPLRLFGKLDLVPVLLVFFSTNELYFAVSWIFIFLSSALIRITILNPVATFSSNMSGIIVILYVAVSKERNSLKHSVKTELPFIFKDGSYFAFSSV